jgi:hypothetical protein
MQPGSSFNCGKLDGTGFSGGKLDGYALDDSRPRIGLKVSNAIATARMRTIAQLSYSQLRCNTELLRRPLPLNL